jgi:SPP1 family predicted phage head-tail adaptor
MKKNFASCLRQIITIQSALRNEDGLGGHLERWQDSITVRAEVQALYERGIGEVFAAMQLMDNSLYRFRIRYMSILKSDMRIVYDQRYFQIKRIINQDEMNMVSVIIAQEIV